MVESSPNWPANNNSNSMQKTASKFIVMCFKGLTFSSTFAQETPIAHKNSTHTQGMILEYMGNTDRAKQTLSSMPGTRS
jgi:hypothetical protein